MFTFAELARSQQPPNSITKAAGTVSGRFSIKKADEDQHLASGWAYVSQDEARQQTEDHSGDQLEAPELEAALGIPAGTLPVGWWIKYFFRYSTGKTNQSVTVLS